MQKDSLRLNLLDQNCSMTQQAYKEKLKQYQLSLLNMQLVLKERKNAVIVVIEGPDAAGKGGAIKRLVERLDPRLVRVYSTIKPTPEEYCHHYMRRFWVRLPSQGNMAIFDRSWYGRILVERVENFATESEWKRAYAEIQSFEKQLTDSNAILVKLYLHITKEEQLKRFKKRESDPYKHWKITNEDWRNRRKWKQYIQCAEDMFEKTNFDFAPWMIIPANYKWYARVKVVQAVADAVKKALG